MSTCLKKRKLNEVASTMNTMDSNSSNSSQNPCKKQKLDDDQKQGETNRDHSFIVQLANDKIIELFALNTINKNQTAENKDNKLISLNIGKTEWKFEFCQLPADPNNDIYNFLDGLFGDKLCDWKQYIIKSESCQSSNNFISIIKDGHGIWRGAILFIIYELQLSPHDPDDIKYLIKIPLTGVDLHFRRQNVGSILVNYTVSIIHQIMNYQSNKYQIIVLVLDEEQPKSFWKKNKFIPAIQHTKIDYHHVFDKQLMLNQGFVRDIESELIIMIYIGEKTTDLVFKNETIQSFKTPKYVNFNQRYCKRDEIEQTEKAHKEWERKKKELEEKKKLKNNAENTEEDELDDESDEDFDIEAAIEHQSSDDNEDDYSTDNDD